MDCMYKGIDNGDASSEKKQRRPPPPPPPLPLAACGLVLLCVACFLVTVSLAAGGPARGDLCFAAAAYTMLALLLYCVGRCDALAADGSPAAAEARERLKPPVWALSAALTALFSSRFAPMMPPPLRALVVAMALLVTIGGFFLLFLCGARNAEDDDDEEDDDEDEAASDQDDKV